MQYDILNKEECDEILSSLKDEWKYTRDSPRAKDEGFSYKWQFFWFNFLKPNHLTHYGELIRHFFLKTTNFHVDKLRARIMYFKKGDKLPLHNFNYRKSSVYKDIEFDEFLTECDFHGYVFLNSVEGSNFIYNSSKLNINQGSVVFFNRHDKGKLTTLESDLYIMMLHIKTNTKLYAI